MIQIVRPGRFLFFIGVILLLIIGGVIWIMWGSGKIVKGGEFEIAAGRPAAGVWDDLAEQGYVSRTLPLRFYGWRQNAASKLQAGVYSLREGENIKGVISRFAAGDANSDELTLTYPEGFTLEQMAERTAQKGIGTKEEFLDAAKPAAFGEQFGYIGQLPVERSLEGYLFPDTYHVFADDSPADVIQRMLTNFDRKISGELLTEVQASGRTLDEIIIMASIIEREVIRDNDMAQVSGVLWKRLDEGGGLGADATVRYVLNKWDRALTVQDLDVDSPYNTRRYRGLPPGPISNPGLRAIIAAIRPQQSEFYYYLSAPNGETIFSKTNEEHNANKAKYLR